MKNILFLMRYPLEDAYNLKQKFDGQIKSAVNLGYNVYYLAYDHKNVYLINQNNQTKEKICGTTFGSLGAYRSTFGFYDLFRALNKVLKTVKIDVIYMRYKIVGGKAIKTLKKFKANGGNLIVEIPSYNSKEAVLSGFRKIVQKVLSRAQKKLPMYVDLYTIIGADDVTVYEGKPALCISNGVCVENFPVHCCENREEIHVLALASMRCWHAYDRLIKGVAEYKGNTPVYIEMVGNDGDGSLKEWQELAASLGVEKVVNFRGGMYGDELTAMMNKCNVAAATLGLHRNENTVGSVLKVREYCARGIPFVYAYDDTCLNGEEIFALKEANNDDPINIEKLVEWVEKISDEASIAEQMRDFAKEKLSWEAQLSKAFNCILE